MKVIGAKPTKPPITRSKPGIPDVRRITAEDLVGSITAFAREYLSESAVVRGPEDRMYGTLGISPTMLARALKATVDNFSAEEPVTMIFSEMYNEMHIRFESSKMEDVNCVARVVSAWKKVGFRVLNYGLTLTMVIPYNDALAFVLRQTRPSAFKREIRDAYFL